jgi:hypothetical protein
MAWHNRNRRHARQPPPLQQQTPKESSANHQSYNQAPETQSSSTPANA